MIVYLTLVIYKNFLFKHNFNFFLYTLIFFGNEQKNKITH